MPHASRRTRRSEKRGRAYRTRRSLNPIWIGVGVVIAALVVGFVLVQASSGGAKKDISPSQAKQEIDAGALVVDIRTREEYTAGHIAQSVWIPLEELANALPSLPHDRMIIVVCRSGVRSAQGRDMLLSAGFTQVACLTGGMQAWVAAGYPTESGELAGP